jgi:hypothetical protein
LWQILPNFDPQNLESTILSQVPRFFWEEKSTKFLEKWGWSLMTLGYYQKIEREHFCIKMAGPQNMIHPQEHVRKLNQPFQHNRNSTSDDEKNKMHTKTPWPGKKLWINPRLYSVNSKFIQLSIILKFFKIFKYYPLSIISPSPHPFLFPWYVPICFPIVCY